MYIVSPLIRYFCEKAKMSRNCDDERESFMRRRFPTSGFNPHPHVLFRHPRTLTGVSTLTQMVSDLSTLG